MPHRARQRHAKKSSLKLVAAAPPLNDAGEAPPLTDDIDALVSALAKTTLGAGINEKELFKLLRPSSSSPAKTGKKVHPSGEKGAATEGARAT